MKRNVTIILSILALLFTYGESICKTQGPKQSPGLYFKTKQIQKVTFDFTKRPMKGLRINHYADGTYSVNSSPFILGQSGSYPLTFIPNRPITFGGLDEAKGTAFEVKRGFHVFRVDKDDVFVKVTDGKKQGEEITFKAKKLVDKVMKAQQGLIQQRIQLYRIDITLPSGRYVLFESEGNVFDNDTFPSKDQGCWYIEVTDNGRGSAKNNSNQ